MFISSNSIYLTDNKINRELISVNSKFRHYFIQRLFLLKNIHNYYPLYALNRSNLLRSSIKIRILLS